jgi:hypothetical protein
MKLDIGLVFPLPLSTRNYLIYQVVGSLLVNGAINFASALPMRRTRWIPVFAGFGSVAVDTCLTAVLLSGLTVVIGRWFVDRDIQRGVVRPLGGVSQAPSLLRWIPGSTIRRALLFAVFFSVASVPLGLGSLVLLGFDGMTFAHFLPFKLLFAVTLGACVTPLSAAVVLFQRSAAQRAPSIP